LYRRRWKPRYIYGTTLCYFSSICPNCKKVLNFKAEKKDGRTKITWLEPTSFRRALTILRGRGILDYRLLNTEDQQILDDAYCRVKAFRFWLPMVINRKIQGGFWEGVDPDLTVKEYIEILTGERVPPKPVQVFVISR